MKKSINMVLCVKVALIWDYKRETDQTQTCSGPGSRESVVLDVGDTEARTKAELLLTLVARSLT